jgi:hypothetical protein
MARAPADTADTADTADLAGISGLGASKLERYGKDVLRVCAGAAD